jgi:putative peptidoglycan lipid II flippase
MHFAPLLPSVWKVALGAAAMGVAVAAGWSGLKMLGLGARATDAVAIAALIPAGAGVYGLVLWRLRIEGREELAAVLARVPVVGRLFRADL